MHDTTQIVKHYVVENLLMGNHAEELGDDSSFLDTGVLDSRGVVPGGHLHQRLA